LVTRNLPIVERPEEAKLHAWLELAKTFQRISRAVVSVMTSHDITLPQFDVLATLRFNDGATQQELAERLLVTKGNVCGLIDRLEGLGWVQRRPDDKDARANRLHVTAAGRAKLGRVLPEHDREVLRAFQSLTNEDIKSLRRLLAKLGN
jgi:DNA-binding MarR family transcriptional regulator